MAFFDSRMRDLLDHLQRRKWRSGTPQGVGPKTVVKAVEKEWVERKDDRLRLTAQGFRRRNIETEYRTGKVHAELRDERLRMLESEFGARTLRALQEGKAVVKVWRRSTPHNWWVETLDGRMLWRIGDDKAPAGFFRRMLAVVSHSDCRIWAGVWEDGLPDATTYRFKRMYCRPLARQRKNKAA